MILVNGDQKTNIPVWWWQTYCCWRAVITIRYSRSYANVTYHTLSSSTFNHSKIISLNFLFNISFLFFQHSKKYSGKYTYFRLNYLEFLLNYGQGFRLLWVLFVRIRVKTDFVFRSLKYPDIQLELLKSRIAPFEHWALSVRIT